MSRGNADEQSVRAGRRGAGVQRAVDVVDAQTRQGAATLSLASDADVERPVTDAATRNAGHAGLDAEVQDGVGRAGERRADLSLAGQFNDAELDGATLPQGGPGSSSKSASRQNDLSHGKSSKVKAARKPRRRQDGVYLNATGCKPCCPQFCPKVDPLLGFFVPREGPSTRPDLKRARKNTTPRPKPGCRWVHSTAYEEVRRNRIRRDGDGPRPDHRGPAERPKPEPG